MDGPDMELVELIQLKGDQRAFEELYNRYVARVRKVVSMYVWKEQDVPDVVQLVFMRMHTGLRNFRGGSLFYTWLMTLATNTAISHGIYMGRKSRKQLVYTDKVDYMGDMLSSRRASGPDQEVQAEELRRVLDDVISSLTPGQKQALVFCELKGMTYLQAAKTCGTTEGVITTQLYRARQVINDKLKQYWEGET